MGSCKVAPSALSMVTSSPDLQKRLDKAVEHLEERRGEGEGEGRYLDTTIMHHRGAKMSHELSLQVKKEISGKVI